MKDEWRIRFTFWAVLALALGALLFGPATCNMIVGRIG